MGDGHREPRRDASPSLVVEDWHVNDRHLEGRTTGGFVGKGKGKLGHCYLQANETYSPEVNM